MTPRSFDSFWVQNELDRARENGIPIFPLLLEGKQWLAVQVLQYVDVRDKSLPPEKFYKRLANVTPRKKTKDDLDELKKLESQAIQFELLVKLSDALKIYYQIKRIDPLFPGIDSKIKQLEYETRPKPITRAQPTTKSKSSIQTVVLMFGVLIFIVAFILFGMNIKANPPLLSNTSSPTSIQTLIASASLLTQTPIATITSQPTQTPIPPTPSLSIGSTTSSMTVQIDSGNINRLSELRTLSWHDCSSLVFSPDGTLLASGAQYGPIQVWDSASGQEVHTLSPNTGGLYTQGLTFLENGRLLVSPGGVYYSGVTITQWDVSTWQELPSPPGLASLTGLLTGSMVFSLDGHLLASPSLDNTISIWDVTDWHKLRTLAGHHGFVFPMTFSSDGRLLASASDDNTIRLWDVATGQELHQIPFASPKYWGPTLIFSPDSKFLLSASPDDRNITLWDVASGQESKILTGHTGGVYDLAFSSNGRLLASASADHTIRLWDAESWQDLYSLTDPKSYGVELISFSPDGSLLASCSLNGKIRIWGIQ